MVWVWACALMPTVGACFVLKCLRSRRGEAINLMENAKYDMKADYES